MKVIGKPVVALVSMALAAVLGAFAYNYKSKASVVAEHNFDSGPFGNIIHEVAEKNVFYGNICLILALIFLGITIFSIILFAKKILKTDGEDKS